MRLGSQPHTHTHQREAAFARSPRFVARPARPHARADPPRNALSSPLLRNEKSFEDSGAHALSSPSSHWCVDAMDEGIRLVVYDVCAKIGKKQTLFNVTGVVEPGEFYGVMGPSGAGKTMLLDIVCFRKSVGKVKGAVLYNSEPPTKDFVQHNVAYVEQQITVQPAFTVEEAIIFSAMLKRPRHLFSREQIEDTVNHVIEQLGLEKIRKSRVGNSRLVRGISGGEARRVSIGISLVQLTRPGLLCLDEPTTGLDSAIGYDILKLIKGCSEEGWTIFTTIHNPSAMMMDHIDGLVSPLLPTPLTLPPSPPPSLSLSPFLWCLELTPCACHLLSLQVLIVSAKVIWFGPYNLDALKDDFERHGFECKRSQHIVEFLLQEVGGGSRGSNEETLLRACKAYEDSRECSENRQRAVTYARENGVDKYCTEWRPPKKLFKPKGVPPAAPAGKGKVAMGLGSLRQMEQDLEQRLVGEKTYANPIWREIQILLKYRTWTLLKDPSFVLSRLLIFVLQSLVFATFWANREKNMGGLIDTIAVLFAVPITLSLPFGLFIPELFHQRGTFIRESHEGCYRSFSYCASEFLTETMLVGIGSVLYSCILYFAIGTFPLSAQHFFYFLLMCWAISLNSVLFAKVATNASKSMEMALLIAPCYWLWNCLVMGFITQYKNMPVYYAWTYWLAYLQYGFNGLMLNQFQYEKWSMCAEIGTSSGFSLQSIIDILISGDIAEESGKLLDRVQGTIQNATAFTFPFLLSDATCSAENQTDVTLPDFISDYAPPQSMLKAFLPLLPTFLGQGQDNGEPSPKCNDLCLPVPGKRLLDMYGMDEAVNKWTRLGIVILFIAGHFLLMVLSSSIAKRFEKR